MNTVPQATDPRGEKRGRDEEGSDAIEASGQPQFKRARLDPAPQDPQVPLLFAAIERGDIAGVTALLTQSPGLRGAYEQGPSGRTLLCAAAATGKQTMVRLLLHFGEPVDRRSRLGFTPLMVAANFGHVGIMRTLCLLGANPALEALHSSGKKYSPLAVAIVGKQLDACKFLLATGVDIQKKIASVAPDTGRDVSFSPLKAALRVDFSDLIGWLLETGRLLPESVESSTKLSLVNLAAFCGAANSVQLLLRNGASPVRKQVLPNGKTCNGVLEIAQEMNHVHVFESALRFRETAEVDKSKWPLPPLLTPLVIDLAMHADLWLSPAGKDADGLKDVPARQGASSMLEATALLWSQLGVHQAGWAENLKMGWLSCFANWASQSDDFDAIAKVLGKNSFRRGSSAGKRGVSARQVLQIMVENISCACGWPAPFSGHKLTPPTEQVMNRMFDLQSELMLGAIAQYRTEFEKNIRRLPALCMDVYVSRSGKLNEPDLYRVMTKEMGLYDPVARAVLRLVQDAYRIWRNLDPARMSDELKALSPTEQFKSVMASLLEDWERPVEFDAVQTEGGKPELIQGISNLLKQQWRLFADAFGVGWPQISKFGPHKPVVVPAESGMEVDVKSVDQQAVETIGEAIEEAVEEVVEEVVDENEVPT